MKDITTIGIGCDHAGYDLKETVKDYLKSEGYSFSDYGTNSKESVDYPDYAHKVAESIEKGENNFGILICGSGNGINIAANRHKEIRSAICWKKELASLARQHNNANVITLPARFISEEEAIDCVKEFLNSEFEGGRHQNRINKINC